MEHHVKKRSAVPGGAGSVVLNLIGLGASATMIGVIGRDNYGSTLRRLLVVAGFTLAAIGLSWAMVPKAEYLPEGNRNLLIGILLPPPGYSIAQLTSLADTREALTDSDPERLRSAVDELSTLSYQMTENLYSSLGGESSEQ